MNVLDEIRPRADHLTAEHSRALLESVLTAPPPRSRRRWSRVAGLGLAGVIVVGGTAYGTSLVPDIVADRFQQIRDGEDGWPDPVYDERLVADVALSNGERGLVWHATTTNGFCEIRDMSGTASRPEDFGVGCARWNPGEENSPRRGDHWQTSDDGPAVVYGDFVGVPAAVARVDVSGPGWTRSFRLADQAFAGEVPAGAEGDQIRFTYLDDRGRKIAGETFTVVIELPPGQDRATGRKRASHRREATPGPAGRARRRRGGRGRPPRLPEVKLLER